jgi:hypothetical protein
MRTVSLFFILAFANTSLAQQNLLVTDQVPPETTVTATAGSTCCGSEHLDSDDRYYSVSQDEMFDTSKDKELLEFRFMLTDSVAAPAPKPRQVVYEWDQ